MSRNLYSSLTGAIVELAVVRDCETMAPSVGLTVAGAFVALEPEEARELAFMLTLTAEEVVE